ncbi:uncharacterized protein LOC129336467 [Eublepharis macularius]|uniref:Uncharacterized protein LOC129331751 n=1 Tax=Eublepharis macularius TaxID=481883 RepID=A0AA97JX25_EUBMA|nr:uncharacterized protein LOC129331751 [Eublepharis macularius]XP_054845542.1 uncharacterized protein LOC129336467 [Eublepharis macularius]
MPPKKGVGVSKGKQPAKRPAAGRGLPASSSDEDEGEAARQEILAKLAALERSKGAGYGQPAASRAQRASKRVSSATFQRDVLNRLSALEGSVEAAGAAEGRSGGSEPGGAVELEAQATTESAEEPPVAVVVDQPEGDGAVVRRGRCRILICGHSMIFWAAHQAKRTPWGSQLGLSRWAQVEWQGRRGLRWPGLLPLLFEGRCSPPPDFLVIHLGGNDLGWVKGKALTMQAQADLKFIAKQWPGVLIIWSAILPRRIWREALDHDAVERARRKANKAMFKALCAGLGIYLPHPRIRDTYANLYRGDGIHLSVQGNEIFLTDLRQGLLLSLQELWGVRA